MSYGILLLWLTQIMIKSSQFIHDTYGMCSVDAVPAFAVTTPVGSRCPCGLLCSFLTPRFAMLCMYIAVAVMMACHLSLIHTLVYMSKGGYCDCMTVKHGMTAYESYRGIHAGVTESGVKIGGSAACRHDNRNNNKLNGWPCQCKNFQLSLSNPFYSVD